MEVDPFLDIGDQQLGDLDGVERGALAEVVVADEQREAAVVDAIVDTGATDTPFDNALVIGPDGTFSARLLTADCQDWESGRI